MLILRYLARTLRVGFLLYFWIHFSVVVFAYLNSIFVWFPSLEVWQAEIWDGRRFYDSNTFIANPLHLTNRIVDVYMGIPVLVNSKGCHPEDYPKGPDGYLNGIAFIDAGGCSILQKVGAAQNAGAFAAIVKLPEHGSAIDALEEDAEGPNVPDIYDIVIPGLLVKPETYTKLSHREEVYIVYDINRRVIWRAFRAVVVEAVTYLSVGYVVRRFLVKKEAEITEKDIA